MNEKNAPWLSDVMYKGFIAPGGRIEFPKSPVECAIREVKEETGLRVRNLKFKGLAEYMNPSKERYMIFWARYFMERIFRCIPKNRRKL